MKTRIVFSALAALVVLIVFAGFGQAQGPPFAAGQVAVYAQPEQLPGLTVEKYLPHSGISVVNIESGREWGLVQKLRGKGFRAGLNLMAHAFLEPNDPYYSYQWHFVNIQAEDAWNVQTGAGVVVAVLDTGLALGGPDGIGCVKDGYDVVNNDNDPADGDGHGTHVSGTIAQSTGNGKGVAGMAYGACIMPVKVLNDKGSGTFADIADGIYYAVDKGANVINMSLGTDADYGLTTDPVMDEALVYASTNGVTVVCASGNDGNTNNVSYPAIYPTTIAVGATDFDNLVTSYSNKGEGLDLVAPGGNVSVDSNEDGYGDGVLQETCIRRKWGYHFFNGTSMASPHVAAVAALLIAKNPNLSPAEIYEKLTSTAKDLGAEGYDSISGHGLIQAFNALETVTAECTDADGDGVCADVDCNDDNKNVYPGATEICEDDLDNDCDGEVNEGCSVACTDDDGDGVCADVDCDDTDKDVYPGATEICGDEIDNNCNGETDEGCAETCTDADADGWCVEEGDCNDNDPTVYPGHPDKVGRWGTDGVDNDCDGVPDK